MENPFNSLEKRLANIEDILFDIKHSPKEDFSNKRYSIKEAAAILRVIPLTVRNYIKNGNLKAEQLGRKYYILHSDLFNSFNEVKSLKYKR
jgi:excisionase family DNA binding protein